MPCVSCSSREAAKECSPRPKPWGPIKKRPAPEGRKKQRMNASRPTLQNQGLKLTRCARVPGLRALAWDGDVLYASRGYHLLRATITDHSTLDWQPVASFRPGWKRRLSVTNRLSARLF